MRQIKFKVRDISAKTWLKNVVVDMDGNLINFNGVTRYYIEGPNYIKVQFTGMYDKNGQEIYERDFIHHENVKEPLQVYWCDATGQWKLGHEEPMRYYGPLYQYPNNLLEVIGNVYENPEFLGKENE